MTENKILGVILAGGLSRRIGGKNKFFKKINNITILDRIISKSTKQVDKLIINANISKNKFSKYKIIQKRFALFAMQWWLIWSLIIRPNIKT